MRYTVRPLSDRTAFVGRYQRSPFSASWSTTENLLLSEVKHLNGQLLVIECDVSESMIRLDGGLYANARPTSPAVRVAFESKYGPLVYATDRFHHWHDNVRAIALGLEALRRVDRYGITQKGQQYTGWKAIGTGAESVAMTPQIARDALLAYVGDGRPDADNSDAALVRRARAVTHPDRRGGDRAGWDEVEKAARVLGVAS